MAQKEVAFKVVVDTSEVSEGVEKSIESVEELGDATKKTSDQMKSGFKAAEQGTKSLGTSIGGLIKSLGVIGLALSVFDFMKDIVSKNQKVMDALSTATTAFEILLYKLFDALEPLGDVMKAAFSDPKQAVIDLWNVIKENLVNRMEGVVLQFKALGTVVKAALDLDWDGVTEGAKDFASATVQVVTGLDAVQQAAAVESFKNFVNDIKTGTTAAVDQAKALVELRKAVELADAARQKAQLTAQTEAESQRQIRDDISRTIEERIAANNEIKRILDKQIEVEKAFAQQKLDLANAEIAISGERTENLRAKGEAELALLEIEERVNSQRSEQLTNQKALEKELFDFQQELRTAVLEGREKELEETQLYYDNLNEIARKAGEDNFEIEAARAKAITDLNEKFRKEDLEKEKKAAKDRIDLANKEKDARFTAASGLAQGLSGLVSALGDQSKASVAIQKTLAIAQIAIDTARSISSAISAATAAAAATGPGAVVATPVFIATQIATVLAAVGQAVAILNSAPGGGSASIPSVSVPTAAAAPSFNPVTTNTTELGNTQAAELAPIQAFVVETQLTESQFNINQIESQATFGGDLGG
jgi:hypothetical protein